MEDTGVKNFFSRQLKCCFLLVLATSLTPALAGPLYELTGTLNWRPTTGDDRLNLDGESFEMTFKVTDPTPIARPDPNGIQYEYQGLGTLNIGGVDIEISKSFVWFYSSAFPSWNDVANFYLFPASGDPSYYYPAPQLPPGSNAEAAVQPRIYPDDIAISATLVIPQAPENALYPLSPFAFTSVPEPSALLLVCLGLAGFWITRRKVTG
jgi:hypothetical protein